MSAFYVHTLENKRNLIFDHLLAFQIFILVASLRIHPPHHLLPALTHPHLKNRASK